MNDGELIAALARGDDTAPRELPARAGAVAGGTSAGAVMDSGLNLPHLAAAGVSTRMSN